MGGPRSPFKRSGRRLVKPLAIAAFAFAFCAFALGACDNPKPRPVPADPMALPPPPAATAAPPGAGMSAGLAKRAEPPGFYLDRVGQAPDPVNRPPAVTPGDVAMVLDGFAFDPVLKAPARGVDVVVDGKAYGTAYGHARPDVANYFKVPALAATGYRVTLPAGSLGKGAHSLVIRVIAADGASYFESPPVPFTVN